MKFQGHLKSLLITFPSPSLLPSSSPDVVHENVVEHAGQGGGGALLQQRPVDGMGLEKTRFPPQGLADGKVVVDVALTAVHHCHVADPKGDDAIQQHVGGVCAWRGWKGVGVFSRGVRIPS